MKKKIILVGKAASGKDHLRSMLIDRGLKPDISATTRPPRKGEVDGIAYHFLTHEQFNALESEDELFEKVEFNGWRYGTLRKSWENSNVFIMTPSGLSQLSEHHRKQCFVVYLDIDIVKRRERMLMRGGDKAEITRRLMADETDFSGFSDYDLRVSDDGFGTELVNTLLFSQKIP